jgi:4-hydroxybenzoate polyprenyltransferase
MTTVKNYLSLVKFSHTIFAMPFALIGFFLGVLSLPASVVPGGQASGITTDTFRMLIPVFFLVIGCMIFARSAAMAFNRYLDSQYDAKNPRTAIREIPAGIITEKKCIGIHNSKLPLVYCLYIFHK